MTSVTCLCIFSWVTCTEKIGLSILNIVEESKIVVAARDEYN